MTDILTVYVDESGDAGTLGRGTRCLALAGVAETGEPGALRDTLVDIAKLLRRAAPFAVHYSRIKNASVQLAALTTLANEDFTAIVVASDSTRIRPGTGLAEPNVHYRYALKLLFERASQLAAQRGSQLDFVIEASGHFDVEAFRQYLLRARSRPGPDDRTKWEVVDISRVRTSPKHGELLLRAADGVSYAFLRALEPPRGWSVATPQLAEPFQRHMWRGMSGSRVLHNGLAFLPTPETPSFLREYPHLRRWTK